MRTNDLLINENTSPYLRRLVLMKRAGINLTPRQQNKLNESVSMVHPPLKSERDRVQASMMKQFKDLGDDEELDLSELNDEVSDEDVVDLEEILKEMGYGEDDDEYKPTINMEDIPELTDEELQGLFDELEKDEEVNEDKGYKEARKLIKDLRNKLFRTLSDSELNSFMDELSNSFSLK